MSALLIAACGSSSKSKSTQSTTGGGTTASTLTLSAAESGKQVVYTAPASVKGGLVNMQFTNHGKAPHGAQLIRLVGGHTPQQALKVIRGNGDTTPPWLRAEGGVGTTAPGQSSSATANLSGGKYIVIDAGPGASSAYRAFTVTPGKSGSLPSTATAVTAAAPSKDHYRWDVSGPLHTGANEVTFASKGHDALHVIVAFRLKSNATKAEIIQGLKSKGPPPAFADQSSFTSSDVLDGGRSQVTGLTFRKPGNYVFFCPLTDRDGGKPHFLEGLLKTVTVK